MIALMAAPFISAQTVNVSGTVSDPTGEVLIGVSVSVKGNPTHGIATDFDGRYTLSDVPSDGTLVFSYVGFKAVEVPVQGKTKIDVIMTEDSELLDEVVVVGYGSLSRKELSSSIVQVNRDDFQKGAMNNPMEMLT
ncbi:MAG: carboxypeptidase-like regulatory domain-containing protein, partial [Muribaculaceae bacterium]|nr:carboxypeptidase-like regulatory domain-containing protein [Muribaculaceae bacterium]